MPMPHLLARSDRRTPVPDRPDADEPPGPRFEGLFRQFYPGLVVAADRLLADRADAEDVVQEAFLKLAADPVLGRPDTEVHAWLRRVTLNLGLNRLRSRARVRSRMQEAAHLLGAAPDAGSSLGDGPLARLVRTEQRDAVRRCLEALPERQRLCLLLRHSGFAYAEIAAALGLAEGSVGVLLGRAERRFREAWDENEENQ